MKRNGKEMFRNDDRIVLNRMCKSPYGKEERVNMRRVLDHRRDLKKMVVVGRRNEWQIRRDEFLLKGRQRLECGRTRDNTRHIRLFRVFSFSFVPGFSPGLVGDRNDRNDRNGRNIRDLCDSGSSSDNLSHSFENNLLRTFLNNFCIHVCVRNRCIHYNNMHPVE